MRNKELYLFGFLLALLQVVDALAYFFYSSSINQKMFFGTVGNNVLSIIFAFLLSLSIITLKILLKRGRISQDNQSVLSLLLTIVLSGAVSNLLDRFIYGGVIDYINLLGINYFNISDLAIVSGILGFGFILLKTETKK